MSNLICKYKRPLDSYVCPDWVEKKQTKLIDILSCAKQLFKTEVILWENARCVFKIKTEKSENCQLSDSFIRQY